jgi:beta-mannosidase
MALKLSAPSHPRASGLEPVWRSSDNYPPDVADLSGTWRAAVADEDLRRAFTDSRFDADAWETLDVPGHWRTEPAFADTDGPLLYHRQFTTPEPDSLADGDDRRWWLVLDGLFYQGDVWLDGDYLGATEGYFFSHDFDVTEQLAGRAEHALAVEVGCAPQTDRTSKRNLTGVFQHWDLFDPSWNPGGIWQPVRVHATGPVRIRHFRAICREATSESATLDLRVVLLADEARPIALDASIAGTTTTTEQMLAAGENRVEFTVTVPDPPLWWPRSLGDQPLHELVIEVKLEDGRASDRRERRVGLRSIALDDWVLSVNGERLFVKGSNHGPTRLALADATPDEVRRDVALAQDANLDMLRVHAHVARPELYEAADEAGLLLWQDMPLQWGYSRAIRNEARRQARELVDKLGHHPSIVVWCGHNEPLALDIEPDAVADPVKRLWLGARAGAAMMLPTWNKTVLDASIRRALLKTDGSRPVIAHSGIFPHPPQFDGTDSHLYFGWYYGDERAFPKLMRAWPRLARFVSEFGAQAVPETAGFMEPDRWPDLDWDRLVHHNALQRTLFDRYVPPADYPTFDEWRQATQAYQCVVIKHHIEALRRIKYRPTGGFLHFCLADGQPAVTWSVLDHEREPKLGYDALRAACAPVIVVADRLPAEASPGERLTLDVHVINDLHTSLPDGEVTAVLTWSGGEERRRFGGTVDADDVAYVGTVEAIVPDTPGDLELALEFRAGEIVAENSYRTTVA